MNPLSIITNQISKQTCAIQVLSKSVIYAAEYMKHKLLYIGQTGDHFYNHFNRHKSDVGCYPDCCELSKHFHNNDFDFEKHLKISISGNIMVHKPKDSISKISGQNV